MQRGPSPGGGGPLSPCPACSAPKTSLQACSALVFPSPVTTLPGLFKMPVHLRCSFSAPFCLISVVPLRCVILPLQLGVLCRLSGLQIWFRYIYAGLKHVRFWLILLRPLCSCEVKGDFPPPFAYNLLPPCNWLSKQVCDSPPLNNRKEALGELPALYPFRSLTSPLSRSCVICADFQAAGESTV